MIRPTRHVVATVDEIAPGTRKIVDVAGRSIGVYNIGGEFFAIRNRCPHQGGPLCEGRISGFVQSSSPGEYEYSRPGEVVRCPWHSWEYDIKTGQSWIDPRSVRVRSYVVEIASADDLAKAARDGAIATIDPPPAGMEGLVKGPYVAETFPVIVEQQYVLVEIGA